MLQAATCTLQASTLPLVRPDHLDILQDVSLQGAGQLVTAEAPSEVEGVITDDSDLTAESMERIVSLPAPTSLVMIALVRLPQPARRASLWR